MPKEKGQTKFERKPIHDLKTFVSADGKYLVLKYVTTWITPIKYFSKILEGKSPSLPLLEFAEASLNTPKLGESDDRTD